MKASHGVRRKRLSVRSVAGCVLMGAVFFGVGCQKSGDSFADEINRERAATSSSASANSTVDANAPMGGQPPKAGSSDYAPAPSTPAPK
jgi:hypothetical protein